MAQPTLRPEFREITGTVPVFEPSVRVWEVTDRDGSYLGPLLRRLLCPRRQALWLAWMNTYRSHETFTGTEITPIASNNNNFVRGAPGEPVLISLDDAETLFHEFGHAIHYLVSTVDYPGLGNVPRDYVEYPSQVHEHWVLTRPILDRFARHYQTGQPMPQALVDRVHNAATFNQGYATVEYLSSRPSSIWRCTIARSQLPMSMRSNANAEFARHAACRNRHASPPAASSVTCSPATPTRPAIIRTSGPRRWMPTPGKCSATGNVFDPTVAAGMRNIITETRQHD